MRQHGRNVWLCGDRACHDPDGRRTRLAVVRGEFPRRRLTPCLGVPLPQVREDGAVVIHCPRCGRDNWFRWRAPAERELAHPA